ncbi:hypothetical protein sos41_35320 [Alphaproteobacteria bacterium SO-S41]|nr:hypothetical protein sos41_35320 [Alphaproteobacteria bacterium SO-S41]
MATLIVGPSGNYSSLAAAISAAQPGDTILLQDNFVGSSVDVTVDNLTFTGPASSSATFRLTPGVTAVNLDGLAPFVLLDTPSSGSGVSSTVVDGNAAANVFTVTDGIDVVHGDLGTDRLIIDYQTAITDIVANTAQTVVNAGRSVAYDGIELFTLTTGAGNDTIALGDGSHTISTGAGHDNVTLGSATGDGSVTVALGEGNNRATLGNSTATITAGDGDDVVIAGDGAKSINLGNGNNQVSVGNGQMIIQTGSGTDTIVAGNGNNVVASGDGNDQITTGSGNDTLDGGLGDDTINAGGGNDTITGGGGNDALNGEAGDDVMNGGDGNDVLNGGSGSDTASYAGASAVGPGGTIIGVSVDLNLQGQAQDTRFGFDTLTGIENLIGSSNADTLIGDSGANMLTGGGGADVLTGGGGIDAFRYTSATDSTASATDTITDFQPFIDKLDLRGVLTTGYSDATRVTITYNGNNALVTTSTGLTIDVNGLISGADITRDGMSFILFGSRYGSLVRINGDSNDNQIFGSTQEDALYGNDGNDTITGGGGADLMWGGAGADTFAFPSFGDIPAYYNQNPGNPIYSGDVIQDFQTGIDRIDLTGLDYASIELNHQTSQFTLKTASGATGFITAAGAQTSDIVGLKGSITIIGGQGTDTINGSDQGELISGLNGDDVLNGNGGGDTLSGGAGADVLNGGGGEDWAAYNQSVVVFMLAPGANTAEAIGDTFISIENLAGSNDGDILGGNDGANTINGNGGNDYLYGAGGDDILNGGALIDRLEGQGGNDTLSGDSGADFLDGGDGDDTASYASAGGGVIAYLLAPQLNAGDAAGDTYVSIENLTGSVFTDYLAGTDGQNILKGNAGDDSLYGASGDDFLNGGLGADKLDGQAGYDYAAYSDAAAGVAVFLGGAAFNTGEAAGDSYTSIEGLIGSAYADLLAGDEGNNTILAGNGNDLLFGGGGEDYLVGGDGDDQLQGGRGADLMDGGNGVDLVSYSEAASGVVAFMLAPQSNTGEAQSDNYSNIEGLVGSVFGDILGGTEGANTISGGGGNDYIFAAGGDDILEGGAGADQIEGQGGFDLASYRLAASAVIVSLDGGLAATGDAAGDTFVGIEGLLGSGFGDTLRGDGGINLLQGFGGDDTLVGLAGDDALTGDAGSDTLDGGAGADQLDGGAGADRFVFRVASDSTTAAFDTIKDFASGSDLIDLRGSGLGTVAITQSGGFFFVDADTSGGAHFHLRVAGTVVAGDILIGALPGDGIASAAPAAPADDAGFLAYTAPDHGAPIILFPAGLSPDVIV